MIDYTGKKIGMLWITGQASIGKATTRWYANCDCGTKTIKVWHRDLEKGKTDCGCIARANHKIKPKSVRVRVAPTPPPRPLHPLIDEYLTGKLETRS